jgi:VanZ family protein
LALLFAGIAVYGSFVPFWFEAYTWDEVAAQIQAWTQAPLQIGSRSDFLANVLLAIPLALCTLAALTVDRHSLAVRLGWFLAVIAATSGFAVVLELAQFWFPPRTPSRSDILAQTAGGIIGAELWMVCGDFVTDRLRSYFGERAAGSQIQRLLEFYLVGLLIYRILPLDLTISPAEIYRKLKSGAVVFLPQLPASFDVLSLYGILRDIAVWIPVGMLTSIWSLSGRQSRRGLGWSVACGSAIVAGSELSQLFVLSHYTTTNAVLLGLAGVTLGAWAMRRRLCASPPVESDKLSPWMKASLWCGVAILLTLGFATISCLPNQPISDWNEAKARLAAFLQRMPLESFYAGSPLNIIPQVVWKAGVFSLVGAALASSFRHVRKLRNRRGVLIAVVVFLAGIAALSIELIQIFLPPHVPDITDVLICISGAVGGAILTERLEVGRAVDDADE